MRGSRQKTGYSGFRRAAGRFLSGLFPPAFFTAILLCAACSFDYGLDGEPDKGKPDIVMEDIDYVRVRGGDPLVRFKAERAERWEDRQVMDIKDFSFEQLENGGETVSASGKAGAAEVQLASGDITLDGGVFISIDSEDITLDTDRLEWKDREKTLLTGEDDKVDVERSDGTSFSGRGFSADIRGRTWNFSGGVEGSYVEKEEEKEPEENGG